MCIFCRGVCEAIKGSMGRISVGWGGRAEKRRGAHTWVREAEMNNDGGQHGESERMGRGAGDN